MQKYLLNIVVVKAENSRHFSVIHSSIFYGHFPRALPLVMLSKYTASKILKLRFPVCQLSFDSYFHTFIFGLSS